MAYNVKFVKGTKTYAEWTAVAKDSNTFYHVTLTTGEDGTTLTTPIDDLYLGDLKLSNGRDLQAAISQITSNKADFDSLKAVVDKLDGADTVSGSVRQLIKALNDSLAAVAKSGKAADVSIADGADNFTATNVEDALAEVITKLNDNSTADKVTLTKVEGTDADSFTARYTIKQGGTEVGTIDIAKDMVATSGKLVQQDGGGNAGTFIEMTIANGNPFYINVADLIEYNAVADTDEITLTDEGHTIKATIKEISGAKITDGTVTKAKLGQAVQDTLDKVDPVVEKVGEAAVTGDAPKAATGLYKKIDDAIAAQKTKDDAQDEDITALKAAVGEGGSVDEKIQAAVKALDVADVPTATVDTTDTTKVTISSVSETDGKIAKGSTTVDVDAYGTAAKVKEDITGTDTDLATADTLKGHRAAITALENKVGDQNVDDRIKALDTEAPVEIAVQDETEATKVNLYTVTETDGIIKQGTSALAADKFGTAAAVKTALEGNADTAKAEDTTINGAKKYADNLIEKSLSWEEF